ncbi:hypothetical protein Pst134EA_015478 [Puccinia striiformis f. sp. tritici]|uniref:hypothetical protein n=1 Tax=Puccinia striiformis f. sp. tritici TaxID=168172 RepID=UPI002008A3F6|nr:hypothetical protein Pst134EA_015478 [Puccinia striiformis f. sp. tritici]KAH9463392.1 hypothetical protein Pst134EA_015478 [Puccinia striiformis f. sp. tritici]
MLGGKLLQNEAIFMLGVGMAETCYQMDSSSRESHGSDKLHGKDTQWQERAWSLFLASEIHFKSTGGNYLHKDSNIDSCSPKHNSTETFLFVFITNVYRSRLSFARWMGNLIDRNRKLGNLREFIEQTKN